MSRLQTIRPNRGNAPLKGKAARKAIAKSRKKGK